MPPKPALQRVVLLSLLALVICTGCQAATSSPLPAAQADAPLAKAPGKQTAVFAGGCFWGVQSVFERVKGVVATTAGYSGGSPDTATYAQVTTGTTVTPSQFRLSTILRRLLRAAPPVSLSVAHDPTQLDRQGPRRWHFLSFSHLLHR